MKSLLPILSILLLVMASLYADAPEVSNLSASQRAGTKLVDITYDVSADAPTVTISLEVSNDGGATFTVPATSLSGAIGEDVAVGNGKTITWDAGTDWNEQSSSTMRFKVVADDGIEAPVIQGMAYIPGGSFQMSDSLDEMSDAPVVTVNVSGFYMGKYEVTKGEWDAVRSWGLSNGYADLPLGSGKAADHPVHSINWYAMVKWCNARSEKEGRTPCYKVSGSTYRSGNSDAVVCDWTANGYRLPTEAEWEKAARGGLSGKRFPWGDTISHSNANYYKSPSYSYDVGDDSGYHPDYDSGGESYTSPVGSFAANRYGLYDMVGNVWEWCWDWYASSSYSNGVADPRGPSSGDERVRRGGSWVSDAGDCWVADRNSRNPSSSYAYYGFRVALGSVPVIPEMAYIPGGIFQMGDSLDEMSDVGEDAPVVTVNISGFYMGKYEVTKAEWDVVRSWGVSNGYADLPLGSSKAAGHPVHSVNWYAMVKWCNARSEKEGRTPCYKVSGSIYRTGNSDAVDCDWTANGYRLPTEAEWEKAARGGLSGKRFPWGDMVSHSNANYQELSLESYDVGNGSGYHPDYDSGGVPYTSPVGSFAANSYGLYDMTGNVWEWCWDWYASSSYSDDAADPRGASSGSKHVLRGGGWSSRASNCRVAVRNSFDPSTSVSSGLGFRVALSSVPQ